MKSFIVIKQERRYIKLFINEILYCKAEGAYTKVYLSNAELIVSKLLKDFEELLGSYNFIRINRSYLVNLDHCYELLTGQCPALILSNRVKLLVSPTKVKLIREEFCNHL